MATPVEDASADSPRPSRLQVRRRLNRGDLKKFIERKNLPRIFTRIEDGRGGSQRILGSPIHQSFMQYSLIEEIKLENKLALSNNVTAPKRLANAFASSSFQIDIANTHPLFSSSGAFTISGK